MSEKIIDLLDLPDLDSPEYYDLTVEQQNALDDAIMFTEEATAVQTGKKIISRSSCFEQPGQDLELCYGDVELVRYNLPPEIRWQCKKCGNKGIITNFKGSPWDLSSLPEKAAKEYLEHKYDLNPFLDFNDFDADALPPPEIMEEIATWLESLSEEEFKDFQTSLIEETNMKEVALGLFGGGLTPDQLTALVMSNWIEPENPIFLRGDLSFEQLKDVMFFHNARVFLLELEKEGAFGLTKELENIKRKHVESLVDQFKWREKYIEHVKDYNKTIDEMDVWPLHTIRVLLDLAGLIRKYKGQFVLVKKNAHLLKEEYAGELYRLLFNTFFKKMNIAYLSNGEPIPNQQDSFPFILYRMQLMDNDWSPLFKMKECVFLAGAEQEFFEQLWVYQDPNWVFYQNIVKPLEVWGLVETRGMQEQDFGYNPDEVRITPLFDSFLQFNEF